MNPAQPPDSGAFDSLDFEGRMSAIAKLVRHLMATQQPQPPDLSKINIQLLTTAVRQTFYRDYSLWDAEFDAIERVVNRTVAEECARG